MDQRVILQEQVREAYAQSRVLHIQGSGSKAFYGRRVRHGEPLRMRGHQGVVDYEPSELFITLRAGTTLQNLQAQLAEAGQILPFEPPFFGAEATIGGTLACGFSGPRRPYAGSARDYVLGVQLLNGQGEILRFGGQVMKNVAGYDVSRLLVGSLGTLGVLLEVTLKVLPRPEQELTLVQELPMAAAIIQMNQWAAQPLPVSASAWYDNYLYLRLSGAAKAVEAAGRKIGGEVLSAADAFWTDLREQRHGFFQGDASLWRLALAPASPPLPLPEPTLIEWGGGQRWLRGHQDAAALQGVAAKYGGHATLFRGEDASGEVFHPLSPPLLALQQRLKKAFDPRGILNPGRLYAAL
ncbi:glycolate oxidase subunit GlcE [Acidithiobacillus montserratensis]|uniref:Glycolate oxidase subunit GlcE n=1 Tax=Acidithiobacillus montserratensis TaxID=2729135 RepID=A0ACD5HFP2_9PROT|nr:glycolate oxidase subunit GlcE [Acidithiobacillus montserratensis]MBN2680288.1 glycolate oxidase subunit GlcE [Acidithiobacillaceae bacterium]